MLGEIFQTLKKIFKILSMRNLENFNQIFHRREKIFAIIFTCILSSSFKAFNFLRKLIKHFYLQKAQKVIRS